MIKHTSPISGIAAYKDQLVATAGYDNRVILWDASTKTSISCGIHDHLANQCQFSPDGKYLVTSSSDYSARLWSIPKMQLLTVFSDHEDDVEGVAFHPNQPWLATVCRDSYLRVFDYQGKMIAKLSGHMRDALSVSWLNDDELITSSDDGTIRRWSLSQQACIDTKDMGGVETDTIVLTPNGVIYAGNDEGNIIIIDGEKQIIVPAHKSGIKRLCYSPSENMLVSLSYDRSFCIWKLEDDGSLSLVKRAEYPSIVWARSCDFLGKNKIVFVTFGSSYIVYDYEKDHWDAEKIEDTLGVNAVATYQNDIYTIGDAGNLIRNGEKVRQLPSLCNFIISVNGRIFTGGQTGELFDAISGDVIYKHRSPLNCGAAFKKNNVDYIIVGSYTGEGIVIKVTDNGCEFEIVLSLHKNAIKSLAASEAQLFSVCATGAAAFHSISDFECLHYLESAHEKIANGCTFLNSNQFASISRDRKLRFFIENDIQIIDTPHANSIKCIVASSDGQLVATGGYHGEVHIYNRASDKWTSHRPTISGISNLCYSLQENAFLASSYDGNVYQLPQKN